MGPSLTAYGWVARASANRSSSYQISLLCEGEHLWSWIRAAETTSQAAVPSEPEAAQTFRGPMGITGLGENQASAAILSQEALGLRFVPRAQFPFAEGSSWKRVLCSFEIAPRWVPLSLGMGGLLGPVHTGLLQAKSAFCAKEKTFGVGFQLQRPPAKQQCPRSQRQPRPSLALGGA